MNKFYLSLITLLFCLGTLQIGHSQCLPSAPDSDNDGVCNVEDQAPNFDDDLDIDDDGIPYFEDDCIDVNQNGICDDVDTAPITKKLKVHFSLKRGFYDNAIQVSLIPNRPNTAIRYTIGTDPDCPTANSGTAYSGPISINSQSELQTLKVIGSNGNETTKVYTHTYLFNGHNKPTVVFSCSPYAEAPGKSETPISFEFIVPSSSTLKSVQEYAGTKPSSGGVQSGTSDKIFFRSAYGAGTMKEDLFSDHYYGVKPVNRFDQLFLRGDHSYGTRLNQLIAHDALRATEQLSPAGRHVYFYEFGKLEDVRHLQERPEGGFMEAWTGIDKPNYEAYSGDQHADLVSRVKSGTWAETKKLINIESFGNFLLNQWVGNCWDFWSNRNYRTAGPTNLNAADGEGLSWHYFNWDWDLAFPTSPTSWRHSAFAAPEGILEDIRDNVEFELAFADIIHCSMYEGGALTGDEYVERVLYRHNELQSFILPNNDFDINYQISSVTNYIPARVNWLKGQLTSNNYYSDLKAVGYSLSEGAISTGQQLTLSNPSGSGDIYYTLDGSDVRTEAGTLKSTAIRYTGPIALNAGVYDVFARVYNPSASNMIDRWSATCGYKTYYIDQAYSNIVINEIHYSPLGQIQGQDTISGKEFEFIELKNIGTTPVNLK
ncbi:MAG: chitobiase/beta-hexosaminidase C-terminal domain-containing protein, partial [Saprospiraceae bacterium]